MLFDSYITYYSYNLYKIYINYELFLIILNFNNENIIFLKLDNNIEYYPT